VRAAQDVSAGAEMMLSQKRQCSYKENIFYVSADTHHFAVKLQNIICPKDNIVFDANQIHN